MRFLRRLATDARFDALIGIGGRGLLVLVKPTALFASIQLDTDEGLLLSQVFLVGLAFLSLTGTNAHRAYYKERFQSDSDEPTGLITARRYLQYLDQIGLQVAITFAAFAILASIWPGSLREAIFIGLVFGVAEKICDEGIRHAQFLLDNLRLVGWSLAKLSASWTAVLLSFLGYGTMGFWFPVLLLAAAITYGGAGPRTAIKNTIQQLLRNPFASTRKAMRLVQHDVGQIGWVFVSMAFLSMDKWLLQFFHPAILPQYLFAAQIASIFLVAQTTFLLAPSRVELISKNPWDIPPLRSGSWKFAALSASVGVGVAVWATGEQANSLVYMPFFSIAAFVLLAPYLDRFYWIAKDSVRIRTDLQIALLLVAGLALLAWTDQSVRSMLIFLISMLLVRFSVIATLIWRHNLVLQPPA